MNDRINYILMIAGILAIAYLVLRYVIPVLFKLLGIVVSLIVYAVGIVIVIAVIIIIIGYISRNYRTRK